MLIWMSQSAYPTMIWQTYDYYYDLTGAYFGAKTACEPIHIQWSPVTNAIKVINNKPYNLKGLMAEASVYNMDGKIAPDYTQKRKIDVDATSATEVFVIFKDADLPKLSATHFLKLKLFAADGHLLSENFYWIGNTYLDYTSLDKMPKVGADLYVSKPNINKAANGATLLTYTITNKSAKTSAFGIRTQLLKRSGEQILPAIFNDGYFSLMQGESKTLNIEVNPKLLGQNYKLDVKAYNN